MRDKLEMHYYGNSRPNLPFLFQIFNIKLTINEDNYCSEIN
jgi:hypothetical protein